MKRKLPYLLTILIFMISFVAFYTIFIVCIIHPQKEKNAISNHAVYDGSRLNYTSDTCFTLDGEWLIHSRPVPQYATFPDALYNTNIHAANYLAIIKVPGNARQYSIMIPEIFTDYTLKINGNQIYNSKEQHHNKIMSPAPYVHTFYVDGDTIAVTITINNAYSYNPTILKSIYFGSPEAIYNSYYAKTMPYFIFSLMCLTAGVFYLVQFLINRNKRKYLYFSIFSLLAFIRIGTSNSSVLYSLITVIPIKLSMTLDMITLPLILVALLMLQYHKCEKYTLKRSTIAIVIAILCYVLAICVTPLSRLHIMTNAFFIFAVPATLLLTVQSFRAFIGSPRKYFINLLAVLTFLSSLYADPIIFSTDRRTFYCSMFAMLLYIVLESIHYIIEEADAIRHESAISRTYSATMEKLKREETNFLSSHLKAHFLFNALNIISGYALSEYDKAKNITDSLLIYLKQLFEHDNLNETNSLANEVELVKAFGYIEQERFPGLNIIYDIPKELPNIQVPALLLQPLLENAINHGIRKKNSYSNGTVSISVRPGKYYVNFIIKDDGIGCKEETLKKALIIDDNQSFHSLSHIQYQLKERYNENITYKSIRGIGTIISFRIPAQYSS